MKKLRIFTIAGAAFTIVAGTLLHFLYEWVGEAAAVVGAVNESTWEHLKLIFWPMLLFAIAEYFAYGKRTKGFIPVKTASLLVGIASIIVLFYTYTGVIGTNFLAADIAIFVIAALMAYLFSHRQLTASRSWSKTRPAAIAALAVLVLLIACFVAFTYYPPHIGLFLDPVTGQYGIG